MAALLAQKEYFSPQMRMLKALLCISLLLPASQAGAQVFENASFTHHDSEGRPASWECSGRIVKFDSLYPKTAPGCTYIYNTGNTISHCKQTIPFTPGKYKKYRMKLYIRTETRVGFAWAWVSVKDAAGHSVTMEALPDNTITGKTPWRQYSVDFTTTADVAFAEAGFQLKGAGKAWFDDVSIEEVSELDNTTVNKVAAQYLGEVRDLLRNQCWYADSVDLEDIYQHALPLAVNATSTGDCYAALAYMLDRLGDPLGAFYDPATTRKWWQEQKINDVEALYPTVKIMEDHYAYIWLPGVTSMKKEVLQRYADTLHQQLTALDQSAVKGWILDLRENVGGNATAMLAAAGPMLNDGIHGKYIRNREAVNWVYKKGKATIDTTVIQVKKHFKPRKKDLPVAVMTSSQTYGAGELIVVAFKGRKNCRSFGEPTAGATYNERRITLSDKAMLFFTGGIIADTKGRHYNGKITADATIHMVYTEDACLLKALKWLKETKTN